ncbi:hypothetical protein V1512DRAFT_225118 [Lipomyces arxii]|uniref:uncharacterized protein n=1 Tax=Lipomyces arxii TaxID=56418 RepID=UPI0034CDF1D5
MSLLDFVLSHPLFSERRLPSLFSDFRKARESNIDGYEANVVAWKTVLTQAVHEGGPRFWNVQSGGRAKSDAAVGDVLVIHSGQKLLDELTSRTWGKPLSLNAVFEEQVATRSFVPVDEFTSQRSSIYQDPQWRVVKYGSSIAGWLLRDSKVHQLYNVVTSLRKKDGLPEADYVIIAFVEEAAKVILSRVRAGGVAKMGSSAEKHKGVYTLAALKELYSFDPFAVIDDEHEIAPSLSDLDFELVIKHLTRDIKEATVFEDVIKFKQHSQQLTPLTEEEVTVARLRGMITTLGRKISMQHEEAVLCRRRAGEYVSRQPRLLIIAKNELKKAKLLESSISKTMDYRLQISTLLDSIESASNNLEMKKLMESSLTVLKQLNFKIGGGDKVSDIADRLRDQVQETGEISRMIGDATADEVDENEIDEEFDRMLLEETKKPETTDATSTDNLAEMLQKASLKDVPDLSEQDHESDKEAVEA